MNDNFWYPREPQRYLTDTQWCDHATEVAHVRLIDTFYALGVPLNDCKEELQNIGKIKDHDYARVRGNLERLGWTFDGGKLRHKKIEATLLEMAEERQAQFARTKAATEARNAKRNEQRDGERNVVPTTTTITTTTKETDTETTTATNNGKDKRVSSLSLVEVFDAWNASGLKPCLVLSDKRRRSLAQRIKEDFFSQNWRSAIKKICESDFCRGKSERGWIASFDWFIQPDTSAKVMEGKYDNRKDQNKRLDYAP